MRAIRRIGLRAVVLVAMLAAPLAGIFAGPASAATPTWTVATLPVPSGATSLSLISVSCTSSTACVAVGGTGSSVATETLAGGKWSVATLPLPSGASSPVLISVSCPSSSDCVAVGHDTSGGATVPLAYTFSSGTWQVDTESMPSGATSAYLTGVSCVTSTQCYAVGTASTGPFDMIPDGPTSWAAGSLPVPSGVTSPYLTGVSCVSSTSCVAVGFATSGSTSVPMVDTLSSGWTATTLPVPSGQTYATLFRVSCTSSSSCVAVGYDNSGVLIETLATGTWAATATSLSLNTMANVGISCVSSTSCVVVGQSSSGAPTAYTLSGTTWTAATLPLPSGQSSASLSGVSCTSSTSCVAVGNTSASPIAETLGVPTATTTTVTASPSKVTWSSSSSNTITFTATVAASVTPDAGTVTFTTGSTTLCSAVALTSGTSTCTAPVNTLVPSDPSSATTVTVTATYSGGTDSSGTTFGGSTGKVSVTVDPPTATVTVTASPSTVVWSFSSSNTITFTAAVTASVAPTGTVTFMSSYPGGSATLCSAVALASGKATCTAPSDKILPSDPASATTVTVSAAYSGDSDYAASSGKVTVTVDTSAVTTTLPVTASPNPVTWSSSSTNTVAITATVTASSGIGTPTGTVTFTAGSTTLCSAVALSSDSATCTVPVDKLVSSAPTLITSVTVTADYSGNIAYAAMSNTVSVTVDPPTATTTVTATPDKVVWSSSSANTVAFDATVSVSSGSTTPTGTVTFAVGSTTLCSAVALSSGSATCTVPVDKIVTSDPTSAQTVTVTASYGGNSTYAASSGTVAVTVGPPTTYVEVSAPSGVITWSSSSTNTVSVTATVKASYGSGVPTGTVTFTAGSTTLCKDVTLSSGKATCTVPVDKIEPTEPTSATMVNITASYGGNSTYTASSSFVTVDIGVSSPTSGYSTLFGMSSSAVAVIWSSSPSNTVTFTATVSPGTVAGTPTGTPTGTVTFTAGSTTLCSAVALSGKALMFSMARATCTVPVDKILPTAPTLAASGNSLVAPSATVTGTPSLSGAWAGISVGSAYADITVVSNVMLRYQSQIWGWSIGGCSLPQGCPDATPELPSLAGETSIRGYSPMDIPSLSAGGVAVSSAGSTAGVKTGTGHPAPTPITAWIGSPGHLAQIGTFSQSAAGIALSSGPVSWSSSGATSATTSWTGGTGTIDLAQGLQTLTVGSWSTWETMFGTSEPAGITSSSSIAALLGAEGYSTDIVLLAPKPTVITTTQSGPGAPIVETAQVPAYEIEMFPLTSGGSPLAIISYPAATVTYTQSATSIPGSPPEPTVTLSGAGSTTTDYPAGSVTTTQFGPFGNIILAGGLTSYAGLATPPQLNLSTGSLLQPNVGSETWSYPASPLLVQGLVGTGADGCAGLCLNTPSASADIQLVPFTTTTVTASPNPATVGQDVTYTATVTVAGKPVTSGTVSFTAHGASAVSGCAKATIDSLGHAKCDPTYAAAGTYPITATYSGNSALGLSPSSGSTSLVVEAPAPPPPPPPTPTCPSGDTGTYPNCHAPVCPSGDTGTYPDCVAPVCPSGDTGTYPDCHAPVCPSGDTGTYPNCIEPVCPSGDTGVYPDCVAPVVVKMSGFVAEKVPPNTVFPHRLHATVTRNGQPVAGYAVTFHLAADSGLTFDGPPVLSVAVLTDSQGVATSPPIRSGSTIGTFVATATGAGAVGATSGTVGSLGVVPVVIPPVTGYRLVAGDGGVFDFGSAKFYGSTANIGPDSPNVVGLANDGSGGYWLAESNGGVIPVGGAPHFGSLACHACAYHLAAPIVGIASTPDGGGYWLVGADGGVFAFGDAGFYGSMGGKHLAAPVVGMARTPHGHGYWLVASDGGVFAFGSAKFYGSMGGKPLNKPVVGIASAPGGHGYWLVASDGGIFAFGSAQFHGSMGGKALDKPVVGMAVDPATGGYWLVAADGGIFAFDAPFYGSRGGKPLNRPVVGMVVAR